MNARGPGQNPPGYREIAAELRGQITAGELPDGAVVPGEDALMKRYGVSRSTARDALDVLKNEGRIVSRQGSKTRVRMFRPLKRRGNERLARSHWGAGRAIWEADALDRPYDVDQLTITQDAVPEDVAEAMGLELGTEAVIRSRRYRIENRPVALATTYVPASIAAGTQIAEDYTGPGGVPNRLTELGYAPATFAEELRARMPTPDEAGRLDLPSGTPVIEITRRAATEDGRIVDLTRMVLDAFAYVLEYSFPA